MDPVEAYRQLWGVPEFPARNDIEDILCCKYDDEWRQQLATVANAIFKMRQEMTGDQNKWGVTDLIDTVYSSLLWLDMPHIPGLRPVNSDPCIDHHSFSAALLADSVKEYGRQNFVVLWWSGRQRSAQQNDRCLTTMVQCHVVQLMNRIISDHRSKGVLKLRDVLAAGYHLENNGLTALEDAVRLMRGLLPLVRRRYCVLFVLDSPFDGDTPEATDRMVEWLRVWMEDGNEDEDPYVRGDVKVLVTGSGWMNLRGDRVLTLGEMVHYMEAQDCIRGGETPEEEARELIKGAMAEWVREAPPKCNPPTSEWDGW